MPLHKVISAHTDSKIAESSDQKIAISDINASLYYAFKNQINLPQKNDDQGSA